MTRVLSVDCATPWAGVALVEQEAGGAPTIVAEGELRGRGPHAASLLALAEGLRAEAGWARSSIDVYAATRGPGSFTGLRVALGTVLGLSLSSGRPAHGIDTLQAMAEAHGLESGPRVPLLDAGRGEAYGAVYDPRGMPPLLRTPPWVGDPASAIRLVESDAVFFGDAAVALAEAGSSRRVAPFPRGVAAAAGRLALARVLAGEAAGGLSPMYLRPTYAEEARKKACKAGPESSSTR